MGDWHERDEGRSGNELVTASRSSLPYPCSIFSDEEQRARVARITWQQAHEHVFAAKRTTKKIESPEPTLQGQTMRQRTSFSLCHGGVTAWWIDSWASCVPPCPKKESVDSLRQLESPC